MSVDLGELKQLVDAIKSDRQAQKEKEKREAWTKYVSLTMVCLAVLTAIATQRAGGYSSATLKNLNDATYHQAHASDQWAFYQSKSIKQHLYEMERDRAAAAGADAAALQKVNGKVEKYEKEKAEISQQASSFEQQRDQARETAIRAANRSREMGLAITIFQVAIALGGVCLVVKKRWLWSASLIAGVLAVGQVVKVIGMQQ